MEHHVIDASVLDYGFVSPPEDLRDHVRRRVGVVIDGFVVTGYSLYGIYLRNADFCQVTNSIAHRNRTGILLYSAYRSRIANCEAFSNDNRCHQEMGNIAIMGYSMECELSNNVAHHTRQHGLRFYGGFYGNILRGNLAYDCAVGMQVKGEFYTAEAAKRYFQTATGAPRPQDLPMLFERNVAHQCTQFSLIPSACLTRQNTGVRALRGSGAMEQNIFVDENELPQTKFATPPTTTSDFSRTPAFELQNRESRHPERSRIGTRSSSCLPPETIPRRERASTRRGSLSDAPPLASSPDTHCTFSRGRTTTQWS